MKKIKVLALVLGLSFVVGIGSYVVAAGSENGIEEVAVEGKKDKKERSAKQSKSDKSSKAKSKDDNANKNHNCSESCKYNKKS